MDWRLRKKIAKAKTEKLFEWLLEERNQTEETDRRWALILQLRRRDIETVFSTASIWCQNNDWLIREAGADLLVLGRHEGEQFVYPKKTETQPILEKLLSDRRPEVVASAIYAVGHLRLARELLDQRMDLVVHKSFFIRRAMSFALSGDGTTDETVGLLLLLMKDNDVEVRDWATFGLGSQCDKDSKEIRQGLFERLYDVDDDTHLEAVGGLARRGDKRVVPALIKRFEEEQAQDEWQVANAWLEAAAEIAAPELLPVLLAMAPRYDEDDFWLDLAIRRCQGEIEPDGRVFGMQED
ncbi:hypothetical protein MNBD_ALPHA08-2050 [hydrothermal vent metagenome]|uniref:FOG: HEAT repeat n=1 Tax=hydrothermal vent metagenome TaxID=652676 RepID=A0A3B0SJI5_9ZZZZ